MHHERGFEKGSYRTERFSPEKVSEWTDPLKRSTIFCARISVSDHSWMQLMEYLSQKKLLSCGGGFKGALLCLFPSPPE
jgi:hypothetical protein